MWCVVASTLPPRVYNLKHSQSTCCSTHWTFFLHRFIRVLLFAQGRMYFFFIENQFARAAFDNECRGILAFDILQNENDYLSTEITFRNCDKKKKWLNACEEFISYITKTFLYIFSDKQLHLTLNVEIKRAFSQFLFRVQC